MGSPPRRPTARESSQLRGGCGGSRCANRAVNRARSLRGASCANEGRSRPVRRVRSERLQKP
eukprot:607215-Alexandrium_andersonii.AAC.1